MDSIFGAGSSVFGLEFSFTIAAPFLEDCPLVGCSTGFLKLCGYSLSDILGLSFRFLIDQVPPEQIDSDARRLTQEFCRAVQDGKEYRVPDVDRKPWMPVGTPADGLICMQTNMHKDGTLFKNMVYMKSIVLGEGSGEGQPYVLTLQSQLKDTSELSAVANSLCHLDRNLARIRLELSALCFTRCSMFRHLRSEVRKKKGEEKTNAQCHRPKSDLSMVEAHCDKPTILNNFIDLSRVEQFDEGRFKYVQKLSDASRNKGIVQLLEDRRLNRLVAAKRMPSEWICKSHKEFVSKYPRQIEMPWQDIGCTQYLTSMNYKYACKLEGVFCDSEYTYVNYSYAPGGDLYNIVPSGIKPGRERETQFAWLATEIFKAFKQLHDLGIVHRDISLENILLTSEVNDNSEIRVIDYAMASQERTFCNSRCGKPSYTAPEMHKKDQDYDGCLADAFSIGVLLYTLFLKDYPWLSTKPGACKRFEYMKKVGFRAYCHKRAVLGSNVKVAHCISESLLQLLEGLLEPDPKRRLSLGETYLATHMSVWDEPFTVQHLGGRNQSIAR